MKTKPLLIGGLVAAVVNFILSFLWYVKLFAEQYGNSEDSEANLVLIFVGMLIGTLALGVIYDRWSGGVHGMVEGFKLGALVGLIPGLGYALIMMSTQEGTTGTVVALEAVYGIVSFGLSGAIIGQFYTMMAKAEK